MALVVHGVQQKNGVISCTKTVLSDVCLPAYLDGCSMGKGITRQLHSCL